MDREGPIGQTLAVRSTLAGLLFGLAYAFASLTISGFFLQRAAFDPDNSSGAADVVLEDPALKKELVDFIVDNTAGPLTDSPKQIEALRATVTLVVDHPEGQKFLAGIIHDAHAHLIGDQAGPVTITGADLVKIVRSEGVGDLPPVILPVPRVAALAIANKILTFLVPVGGILTVLLFLLGFTAHPDRDTALRWLAYGLILVGLVVALLGYVAPKFVVGLASESVWANIPGHMADAALPLLIGLELVLIGGALGIFAGSGMVKRRRRWNAPINTYRYTQDRGWG